MGRPTSTHREPLDRTLIVSAAVALADEQGVVGVSMRRLAERLDYRAMALYNHVAGKDELVTLMVDAVAAEIPLPPAELPPLQAIRAHAVATRATFVRHRWVPEYWQRCLPGPARTERMEALLRTFDASGLPHELAHHGFHAVTNHVLGYTLQELSMGLAGDGAAMAGAVETFLASISPDTHPHTVAHVHEHLSGRSESSFELVLDLILDGLVRLGAEP